MIVGSSSITTNMNIVLRKLRADHHIKQRAKMLFRSASSRILDTHRNEENELLRILDVDDD